MSQARFRAIRDMASSWRTLCHLNACRKVPRVEGALTLNPRIRAVSPARNTSASSMQSPPVSDEQFRVKSLSAQLGLAAGLPRMSFVAANSPMPRPWSSRTAGNIPALAIREPSSKTTLRRYRMLHLKSAPHFWVLWS